MNAFKMIAMWPPLVASRRVLIKQESTTIFLTHSNAHTIIMSLLVVLFTIVSHLNIIACSRFHHDPHGANKQNHHSHNHHHHHHHQNQHERRHQRAILFDFEQQSFQQQSQQQQQQRFNAAAGAPPAWPHSPQEQPPVLDQCCACDEAKYELVFEGLWSKYTHPDDFPENYWLAYFSDIIGASHSNDFKMWAQDSLASEGVRELAETGATKKLEYELKQVSAKTRTIIKARELRYPTLNSKTSAVFRTDKQHHLVSILSKLGPSPDWMVGVSGLELCQLDCTWAAQRIVNLYLWDAGTDSGDTFTSPDAPSRPQERVRPYRRSSAAQLSSQTNATMRSLYEQSAAAAALAAATAAAAGNQQASPFDQLQAGNQQQQSSGADLQSSSATNAEDFGGGGPTMVAAINQAVLNNFNGNEVMKPFARLTVTRQRIYEKSCNAAAAATAAAAQEPNIAAYSNSKPNNLNNQANQQYQGHLHHHNINTEIAYEPVRPPTPSYSDCRFTEWTDWSSCSSTCGKGIRTRTRSHLDDQAELAGCSKAELIEKEICLSECLANGTTCVTRDWSDWSKCSVDCGQGIRKRTRSPIGQMRPACGAIELAETEQCTGTCDQDERPTSGGGGSGGTQPQCAVSEWSEWSECPVACGTGTKIRFRQLVRKEDAKSCSVKLIQKQACTGRPELCKQLSNDSRSTPLVAGQGYNHNHNHHYQQQQLSQGPPRVNPDFPVIDCKLSSWSPWSTCSAVCGLGRRTRSRYVIQMPQNGGKSCDKKLTRMQRCKDLPPCPQDYNQPPVGVTGPKSQFATKHNHQNHQQSKSTPHKTRNEIYRTTTTTTTPGSSMMDDEDESKFSRLLKSELGHLQLTSWTPTESYISDGIIASTEMELIGSSSFQIKNGFIYPFNERDRRQMVQ